MERGRKAKMAHRGARLIGILVNGVGIAGVLAAILSLPAIWLAWEANESHAQATLVMGANATRVQTALFDLFARFERATASLQAQDLRGEPVPLTGRLLRAEPWVMPATGLTVVNSRGQQVASTLVGTTGAGAPVWWFRAHPPSPTRQAALLGCGVAPPDAPGWILARDIDGMPDGVAAEVASTLSSTALRALVQPNSADNAADGMKYVVRDADGCELSRAADAAPAGTVAGATVAGASVAGATVAADPLVQWYRAALPARWLMPEPASATVKVANLTWTGTIGPDAEMAARTAAISEHAQVIEILMAALCGLLLLAIIPRPRKPISTMAPAPQVETSRQEMVDLRARLDGVTGGRDPVLAAIGHDVRTPMNSILGICAVLLDGDLDDTQRKWLWRIRASCDALLAMLNGMLEIAAAGMDRAEIHREAIDIASLIEEVGEVLRPQAEDKGLDLLMSVDASVMGIWNADATRLRQVLFNLGGNAIKYTSDGSV